MVDFEEIDHFGDRRNLRQGVSLFLKSSFDFLILASFGHLVKK